MRHLAPQDMMAIRAALQARREAVLARLRASVADSDQHQFMAVLGQSPGDSSDEALAASLADLSAARIDHEVREYRGLEAALAHLESDDFGVCADCGAGIPAARLLIEPGATRCVSCQSLHERTHAGQPHGSL